MAITYVQGGHAITGINTEPQKIVWHNELADQFMERAQLYKLSTELGLGKMATDNVKFNWGEYNKALPSFTASDTASGASGSGTVTLTAASGDDYKTILADDVFYNPTNDVYLVCTERPTSKVVKFDVVGATAFAGITANDAYNTYEFTRICNIKENGLLETEANLNTLSYYAQVTNEYNYCQNLEHWSKIDEQLSVQPWEFSDITRLEHNRAIMLQDTIDDLERLMWYGKRVAIATGQGNYGSRGFVNFGIQTQTGTMSTFTYQNWLTFIRTKVMLENQKRRLPGFCNSYFLQWIQELVEESAYMTLKSDGSQDQFGLEVFTLVSPTCTIDFRWCRALDELYSSSAVCAVTNLSKIGLRHLNGMDLTTKLNVQPTRAKFILDNTYATMGMIMLNAGEHSMLTLS